MYTLECIYDERGNVVEVMLLMLWQFSHIRHTINTQTSTGRLVVAGPGHAGYGQVGLGRAGPDQVGSGRAGPDFFFF